MSENEQSFTYILGEKEELILVLFQGKISARENSIMEKCQFELKDKPQKVIIFNFRDVSAFIPGAHAPFAKIQKMIRDSGKLLGICGLRPEIKLILLQSGIIREAETFNNIPDAWKSLRSKLEMNPPKPK